MLVLRRKVGQWIEMAQARRPKGFLGIHVKLRRRARPV
jgi:hypothetical protein